jgi:hypothetical protein
MKIELKLPDFMRVLESAHISRTMSARKNVSPDSES